MFRRSIGLLLISALALGYCIAFLPDFFSK
jgi:hypothetical protein